MKPKSFNLPKNQPPKLKNNIEKLKPILKNKIIKLDEENYQSCRNKQTLKIVSFLGDFDEKTTEDTPKNIIKRSKKIYDGLSNLENAQSGSVAKIYRSSPLAKSNFYHKQ